MGNIFGVYLLADTNPTAIPPDRMILAELKELKIQLKDLLNNGFLRPSIYLWGAPFFLYRRRMGP